MIGSAVRGTIFEMARLLIGIRLVPDVSAAGGAAAEEADPLVVGVSAAGGAADEEANPHAPTAAADEADPVPDASAWAKLEKCHLPR